MRAKYEQAKNQGLNWQALLIEETQSDIKTTIFTMVLHNRSKYAIKQAIDKIIKDCIKDLENEELKQKCDEILYNYANMCYNMIIATYGEMPFLVFKSVVAVNNRTATPKQEQQVIQYIAQIPDSAYNIATPLYEWSDTYMKRVAEMIDQLTKFEPKSDYTERVNLRNTAEIIVRAKRHEEELQDMKDKGINLIWIVPHANCSERCEKWQGKLYSIDNTNGTIDNISYQPLRNATDIYETTKGGKVYKNGCLSGFNCRHTIEPYVKGNKPIEIPSSVVERQRKVNNTQRYLERQVRNWRLKALLLKSTTDQKRYEFAKNKAIEWNKRYVDYCAKNKVASYPSRTEVI